MSAARKLSSTTHKKQEQYVIDHDINVSTPSMTKENFAASAAACQLRL
jgi:hypothetical protein